MFRYSIIALVIGASIPTQLHAQEANLERSETASNTIISKERVDAALRYLDVIDYDKQLKTTMELIAPQYVKLSLDNLSRRNDIIISDDLRNGMENAWMNL